MYHRSTKGDPMSNATVFNSAPSSSDHARDEDDLKALKLQDEDLDHFAAYFESAFQGNSRSITVLVALLKRLSGLEKLRQQKQSGIWIEDVVGRFTHRLYTTGEPGFEAASRFGNEASDLAEQIFSEVLQ
jgi:hypothetical protein